MSSFKLIAGVAIPDTTKLKREYKQSRGRLYLTLSAEDYPAFWRESVKLLGEGVFFFVEIPDDNDQTRLYYLDNCTASVAQAILKRYSSVLYSDGVIKFGFGSHSTEDEIYMMDYQTLSIYSQNLAPYEELLEKMGYLKNKNALLAWDILSEDNAGECTCIEADDESYVDMINNLIDVGMYPAQG